jgi:sigma-B regulation protein RsbU (phosphoserine phosphatase)
MPTFPVAGVMMAMEALRDLLQLLLPAVFLRFCLVFPEDLRSERSRHRQRWLLVPPLALAVCNLVVRITAQEQTVWGTLSVTASAVLFAGYLLTALGVLIRKARRQDRWVAWSKLRLAVLGIAAGLLPLMVATVLHQIWPSQSVPLDSAAVLFLPLAPAGFSLALLRAGAIDLATLLRQAMIALALGIPLAIGAVVFLEVVSGLGGTARGLAYLGAIVLVALASVLAPTTRRRVADVVDRVFFPENDEIRAAAAALGSKLSHERDPQALAQILVEGMQSVFDARRVVLYVVRDDALERLMETAHPAPAPARPPREGYLLRAALDRGEMVLVEPLLQSSRGTRLDPASRKLAADTDAVVLCPLVAGGATVALLLLGPPASAATYTALHLFHVEALARQAGASLENALLHREDLQRERLRTEMALARDIQSKLLPEEDLHLDHVSVCGRMISSQQVGGDLFDHFVLADGRIAFAVADAAGKGVPASLLTSGVRTAVRETLRPGLSAQDAMVRLNRRIHGMTSLQNFVALFLGLLHPRTGVLEYCVAGIEPPLWHRAGLGRLEILNRGGPVLGIDPAAGYKSGIVRMAPGDVVLAYTDGMIDQENTAGDPYGPMRLARAFQGLAGDDPAAILASLLSQVSDFGGDTATDDRTVVVVGYHEAAVDGTERAPMEVRQAGAG